MHAFCAAFGVVVLGTGLVDVFLTALNYDGAGFIAVRLCGLQWYCFRGLARHLPRRWRMLVLRQVLGLIIVLNMTFWLGTVVIGYGLVYYSQMHGMNFQYSGQNLGAGLFSAMYFSAAQLATVGTSQISPETDVLRAVSIMETITGLGLITLILTFLFGVYQVVHDLRALASNFDTAEHGLDHPLASLGPYFAQSELSCLDNELRSISANFWSYTDGLRQHPLAYYFQSGKDQFSLPYVLHMLSEWIAALRWGLPSEHPITVQPVVTRLAFQFEQFADRLQAQLGWTDTVLPDVVPYECFLAAYHAGEAISDQWLGRFLLLDREMRQLARRDRPDKSREVYQRYQLWLPFAWRADQTTAAVSGDLDFRSLMRGLNSSDQVNYIAASSWSEFGIKQPRSGKLHHAVTTHHGTAEKLHEY
jgi:ion channel